MADQFRTYTKFTRHVDNAKEVISASDINKIQSAVNTGETHIIKLNANDFLQRALFAFDNNFYVNSMFADTLENLQYIDMSRSTNILYNEKEKSLYLGDMSDKGSVITVPMSSTNETPMNDFVLLVDEYIPVGASIKYFLSVNNIDFYPIKANDVNNPNHFNVEYDPGSILNLILRIELTKNFAGESPRVSGYVVMYNDPVVERSYGLINPDLKRFQQENLGDIILIRDRMQGDKLVKVIEPNMVTTLEYNENGSLKNVITNDGSTKVIETLIYGNYINSQGQIETVLLQVSRKQETLASQLSETSVFEGGSSS